MDGSYPIEASKVIRLILFPHTSSDLTGANSSMVYPVENLTEVMISESIYHTLHMGFGIDTQHSAYVIIRLAKLVNVTSEVRKNWEKIFII